ncbi:MAG: DMT family transporter [Mangrovicoccus sp.]|nr:DMT family transporter [Mangrovicoccus sp.]
MTAFAANSILNRLALTATETGPASFAGLRLLSGALMLAALVAIRRNGGGVLLRPLPAAALLLYVLGFSFAYVGLDAGAGALILFGGVQITMFAGAVIAGEHPPLRRWLGAAVAFSGLAWLLWPEGASAPPLGASSLMLAAALGWGVYSLIGRGARDPLASTAGSFLLASPLALLLWWGLRDGMDLPGAGLAVISGAVTSGLGYALWYRVLPELEASAAGVAQLTVPVIAAFGGLLFLSEPVSLRFVTASVLVLGGVAWALLGERKGRG